MKRKSESMRKRLGGREGGQRKQKEIRTGSGRQKKKQKAQSLPARSHCILIMCNAKHNL